MSKNLGGYLRGPWWRYMDEEDEKTRRCYVIAWGHIVREPMDRYDKMRSVRFVIKTGRGAGRNEKHLVCVGYGERTCTVVMRAMEKGDVVFVAGTWVERISNTKKGLKPTYEAHIYFIVPQGLVGFLLDLYSTPQAQKMVEDHQNEDADPFEYDE